MPAPTDSLHLCEDWLMVIYSTLICYCLFVYFLRLVIQACFDVFEIKSFYRNLTCTLLASNRSQSGRGSQAVAIFLLVL